MLAEVRVSCRALLFSFLAGFGIVVFFHLSGQALADGPDSPAHAIDQDAQCAPFMEAARRLAPLQGRMIDEWSRLERIELSCTERVLIFHQRLAVPARTLIVGWKQHMAQRWTRLHCSGRSLFSDGILRHGWTIAATLATGDGTVSSMVANCRQPEA